MVLTIFPASAVPFLFLDYYRDVVDWPPLLLNESDAHILDLLKHTHTHALPRQVRCVIRMTDENLMNRHSSFFFLLLPFLPFLRRLLLKLCLRPHSWRHTQRTPHFESGHNAGLSMQHHQKSSANRASPFCHFLVLCRLKRNRNNLPVWTRQLVTGTCS